MRWSRLLRNNAFVAAMALASAAAAQPIALGYIGQQIVPSGLSFAGTTVGGLSGIDYVRATGRYVSISDDRSGLNPARYYGLALDLDLFVRSATPGSAGVAFESVTTILTPAGTPFTLNTVDPEGIRRDPVSGHLYWSNEGQRTAAGFQAPTVREMTSEGVHVRDFAVPASYVPAGSAAADQPGDRGIVNNLAFESLALSRDGRTLYTATENALAQDGPIATPAQGSPVRLLAFDVGTGAPTAEYVYRTEPVAISPQPAGAFATNGLTDLLAIGDGEFIAIERSFATGALTPGTPVTGNTIRLFHVDVRSATNVAGQTSVAGIAGLVEAQKSLLLDLSTLRNDDGSALALDNIEGLTFGPDRDGLATLILASDNNFSGTQFTQFVALSVAPIPEPQTWALLAAGLGGLGYASRRRTPSRRSA